MSATQPRASSAGTLRSPSPNSTARVASSRADIGSSLQERRRQPGRHLGRCGLRLKGADSSQQLIVSAALTGGRGQDLTEDVEYLVADPKVVRVSKTGRVLPLANGTTKITAVYGEMLTRQPLRFLLADDPGAGKTIMAGLLIKELLIRGDL